MTYAANQLRELLERGPYEGEDFFRLKATGNGETMWVNVSPAQLRAIADVVTEEPENPGLHPVVLLLDTAEQPQTTHELGRLLLTWADGPLG